MKSESELVFGIHSVESALKHQADSVTELWIDDQRHDDRIKNIKRLANQAGKPVHAVDKSYLNQHHPDVRHQGVVARIASAGLLGEADLNKLLQQHQQPLLLVLDGVQDPHNLGACLRTADAVGVSAVIVPKDRAVGLTAIVRKVASGAAETVPLIQVTNLARCLKDLKQQGVWLVGLAGEAEDDIYATDLAGPIALVMGAEGSGMRRLTKEHCDFLVKIPMSGTVESLNVSVATGVCLYEAYRQRNHAKD